MNLSIHSRALQIHTQFTTPTRSPRHNQRRASCVCRGNPCALAVPSPVLLAQVLSFFYRYLAMAEPLTDVVYGEEVSTQERTTHVESGSPTTSCSSTHDQKRFFFQTHRPNTLFFCRLLGDRSPPGWKACCRRFDIRFERIHLHVPRSMRSSFSVYNGPLVSNASCSGDDCDQQTDSSL